MGGNDEGRKRKTEKSSYSLLLPDEIPLARAPRGVLICPKPLQDFTDSSDYGYSVCLCGWARVYLDIRFLTVQSQFLIERCGG